MDSLKRISDSILKKRSDYFLCIIILITFSGCAANSPEKVTETDRVPTPSSYYSKLDELPSNQDWIKEISDDKVLGDIIKSVLKNNIDLKKAANNVKRAAYRAKITASNRYPKFAAGVGGQRNSQGLKHALYPLFNGNRSWNLVW